MERARALKQQSAQREGAATSGPAGVNLYVKNLDESTDDDSLKALFEQFGTITSVSAVKDEGGKCKGFGFVSFQSPDDATKAVTEMHLKVVKGKPLYVGLAEKKEVRAERLRNRYTASSSKGKGGGKGGKGGPMMGGGMGGYGGMQPQMGGPMMGNPMMGQMGGKGPMMGNPMMGGPRPMMGPAGGPMMGMMGNPQMMQMMQKGNPQMMGGMMGKGMPGMPGMMRPPMQQGAPQGARPPMPQQQLAPQQPAGAQGLNASALAAAPPAVQKQMIGEKLFPLIAKIHPEMAGKVTGMMLEMDNSEFLMLLESEPQLRSKVNEALQVLGGGGK